MSQSPNITLTADGSATLYRSDIDEHYHSVKGAVAESRHVYVASALLHFISRKGANRVRLLEVGFGTGLNFQCSVANLPSGVQLHYMGLESSPIDISLIEQCGYCRDGADAILDAALAPWDTPVKITDRVTLQKLLCDATTCPLPDDIDVVYFDAFAPDKQPEMWTASMFQRLFAAMSPGGVLTTYCAKGSIRRLLAATGFIVERLPGPPGGKREMLRATKPDVKGGGEL